MHQLIEELEREARNRSRTLENQGRLTGGFTTHFYPLTHAEQRELERLKAAMLLATDAATYVDLANGQPIPRHRLNADYLHLLERWERAA